MKNLKRKFHLAIGRAAVLAVLAAVACLSTTGAAHAQDQQDAAAAQETRPTTTPTGPLVTTTPTIEAGDSLNPVTPSSIVSNSGAADQSSYLLGPGDSVSVTVTPQAKYGVAQLPVNQDGSLDYPVIGRVQASGKTVSELAGEIKARLDDYCVNPDVTVTLTALHPQVVYVSGGVQQNKALDIRAASTLAKAITLAGGPTETGTLTRVAVVRGSKVLYSDMYSLLVQGKDNGQNVALQPGDLVVVPTNTAKVTVLGSVTKPGTIPLEDDSLSPEGPWRLSDAIGKAGGTDKHGGARIGQVAIVRQASAGGKPQVFKYDYGKFLKNGDLANNPVLQDNDIIVVPEENHPLTPSAILGYLPFYSLFQNILHF